MQDFQDFLSPSEQDLANPTYREGWCGGGRRALPRLDALSVIPTLARDRPSPYGILRSLQTFSPCDGCASIDIKVLTDLKPSFPNPDNLANLVNPVSAFLI